MYWRIGIRVTTFSVVSSGKQVRVKIQIFFHIPFQYAPLNTPTAVDYKIQPTVWIQDAVIPMLCVSYRPSLVRRKESFCLPRIYEWIKTVSRQFFCFSNRHEFFGKPHTPNLEDRSHPVYCTYNIYINTHTSIPIKCDFSTICSRVSRFIAETPTTTITARDEHRKRAVKT